MRELANRGDLISSAATRLQEIILPDGNMSAAQTSLELKSLRVEMDLCLQEWQYVYDQLGLHRESHGC